MLPHRRNLLPWVFCVVLAAMPGLLRAHGSLHDLIHELDRQIGLHRDDATLYLRRAELFRLDGQSESARGDYEYALTLDPGLREATLGLAMLLRDDGDMRSALNEIDELLSVSPQNAPAHLLRAEVLTDLDQWSMALVSMELALLNDARPSPDTYLRYARMLVANEFPDTTRALAVLDEGMERLGVIVSLQLYAIELDETRGCYDQALERVDLLVPRFDREEVLLTRRGEILESARRPLEALVTYTEALDAIDCLSEGIRATTSSREREAFLRGRLRSLSTEIEP